MFKKLTAFFVFVSLAMPARHLGAEGPRYKKYAITGIAGGSLAVLLGAKHTAGHHKDWLAYPKLYKRQETGYSQETIFKSRQEVRVELPLNFTPTHVEAVEPRNIAKKDQNKLHAVFDRLSKRGTKSFKAGLRLEVRSWGYGDKTYFANINYYDNAYEKPAGAVSSALQWAKDTWPRPPVSTAEYADIAQRRLDYRKAWKATLYIDTFRPIPKAINTVMVTAGTLVVLGSAAYLYFTRSSRSRQ